MEASRDVSEGFVFSLCGELALSLSYILIDLVLLSRDTSQICNSTLLLSFSKLLFSTPITSYSVVSFILDGAKKKSGLYYGIQWVPAALTT
jgi:hypothetical protein